MKRLTLIWFAALVTISTESTQAATQPPVLSPWRSALSASASVNGITDSRLEENVFISGAARVTDLFAASSVVKVEQAPVTTAFVQASVTNLSSGPNRLFANGVANNIYYFSIVGPDGPSVSLNAQVGYNWFASDLYTGNGDGPAQGNSAAGLSPASGNGGGYFFQRNFCNFGGSCGTTSGSEMFTLTIQPNISYMVNLVSSVRIDAGFPNSLTSASLGSSLWLSINPSTPSLDQYTLYLSDGVISAVPEVSIPSQFAAGLAFLGLFGVVRRKVLRPADL